jgi:hypothetical protein
VTEPVTNAYANNVRQAPDTIITFTSFVVRSFIIAHYVTITIL